LNDDDKVLMGVITAVALGVVAALVVTFTVVAWLV